MLSNHIGIVAGTIPLFAVGRIAVLKKRSHNSGNPIIKTNGQSITTIWKHIYC